LNEFQKFQFDTGTEHSELLGADFLEILGQRTPTGCENIANFVEKLNCELQSASDASSASPAIANFPPDAPPRIFPSSAEKSTINSISDIESSVEKIVFNTDSIDSVPIEITLKSSFGTEIPSDFSTELDLDFPSDLAENFTISPSPPFRASGGRATFFLTPKFSEPPENFNFSITATSSDGEKISKKIPVKFAEFDAVATAESETSTASDPAGIPVEIKIIQNLDQSTELDGDRVKFHSEWGRLEPATVQIKNGIARATFFPGEKSGTAEIQISHPDDAFPPQILNLEIGAGPPSKIEIAPTATDLLPGANFTEIRANLADDSGNEIKNLPARSDDESDEEATSEESEAGNSENSQKPPLLTWKSSGLEIRDAENLDLDPDLAGIQTREPTLLVRALPDAPGAWISVESEGFSQKFNFNLPENPKLEISPLKSGAIVDATTPIDIIVRAVDDRGERIDGERVVHIFADPPESGQFPKKITLRRGVGHFAFFPGTLAGTATISVASPGIPRASATVDILPDQPAKILFSATETSLEIDDSTPLTAEIRVVDRFGNLTPTFDGEIRIRPTSQTRVLDLAEVKPSRVVPVDGRATVQISHKNKIGVANFIADVNPARWTPPAEKGSGTGESSATPKILLPRAGDAISVEISRTLSPADFARFAPNTIFAQLWGFPGGDLTRPSPNFASSFLFSGKTAAVATLIADPAPKKSSGFLGALGEFTGELEPRLRFGDFFETAFFNTDDERVIGVARVIFDGTPEFHFKTENSKTPEPENSQKITFLPATTLATATDRTVFWNGDELFQISEKGGIIPLHSDLEFTSLPGSILKWEVWNGQTRVGNLEITPPKNSAVEIQPELRDFGRPGIFIAKIASDIELIRRFAGNSTAHGAGAAFVSRTIPAPDESRLGSPKKSAEDYPNSRDLNWKDDFRPASIFATGATVGDATRPGASDIFILLGDPAATLPTQVPDESSNFCENPSPEPEKTENSVDNSWQILWKNETDIDAVFDADVDGDGDRDVFFLVGDVLKILRNEGDGKFADAVELLRFADGVRTVFPIDNDADNFTEFIQLNSAGDLILHRNTDGKFTREPVRIPDFFKITAVRPAKLNSDTATDLVLFGTDNILRAVVAESEYRFFPPQKLGDFSPNFAPADESTADLALDPPPDLPILKNLLASWDGSAEFSTSPGTLAIWDSDTPRVPIDSGTDLATVDSPKKFFIPLSTPDLPFPEIKFRTKKSGDSPARIDDEITSFLTISVGVEISDFQLLVPPDSRTKFLPDSLACTGCSGEISLASEKTNDRFQISVGNLPAGKTVVISWKNKIKKVPPPRFFTGDFETSPDKIDDIVVFFAGNAVQFISVPSSASSPADHELPPQISYQKSTISLKNFGEIPGKDISDKIADIDLVELKNSLIESHWQASSSVNFAEWERNFDGNSQNQCFDENSGGGSGGGSSGNSGGDSAKKREARERQKFKSVKKSYSPNMGNCGDGCGLSISLAPLFPPGDVVISVPPFSQIVGLQPGLPAFAYPTSLPVPPPVVVVPAPAFYGVPSPIGMNTIPGTPYNSTFRFYIAPTINGTVALAFCGGLYAQAMATQPLVTAANCAVVVPPIPPLFCPLDDAFAGVTDAVNDFADSVATTVGAAGLLTVKNGRIDPSDGADFTLTFDGIKPNITVSGADVFSSAMQKIYRGLSRMIKLPNLTIHTPKTSSSYGFSGKTEHPPKHEGDDPYGFDFGIVKGSRVAIPVPKISEEDIERLEKMVADWKEKAKKWSEEADARIDEIEKCEEEYGLGSDDCEGFESSDSAVATEAKNQAKKVKKWIARQIVRIDKNVETVKGYFEFRKIIVGFVDALNEAVEQIRQISQTITNYLKKFVREVVDAVRDWQKAVENIRNLIKNLEIVAKFQIDFTLNCPKCNVNRGTIQEFAIRIFLKKIVDQIVENILNLIASLIPRIPDIILDFSKLKMGIEVPIPTIEAQEIEISFLPELSASIDFDLPVPPDIPLLPEFTGINFNIPNLDFPLPPLPKIPRPPNIDGIDFFASFEAILDILKPFMKILCWLQTGVMPVPEWYVKPYIEQLTNRLSLFAFDFVPSALVFPKPAFSKLDPIELDLGVELLVEIDAIDQIAKALQNYSKCMIQKINQSARSGSDLSSTQICEFRLAKTTTRPDPLVRLAVVPRKSDLAPLDSLQKMYATTRSQTGISPGAGESSQIFATATKNPTQNDRDFQNNSSISKFLGSPTLQPKRTKNYIASADPNFRIPPEKLKSISKKTIKKPPRSGVFLTDPATGLTEKIFDSIPDQKIDARFSELDGDGQSEILTSIGDEIRVKFLTPRDREPADSDPPDPIEWNFDQFAERFLAVGELDFETTAISARGTFEPAPGACYFEWSIFSSRDALPGDPDSPARFRNGFLCQPETPPKFLARVSSLRGNPAIVARGGDLPLERGQTFTQKTEFRVGAGEQVSLEFFDGTTTTIFGGENYTLNLFDDGDDTVRMFQSLETGNFFGRFFAKKGDKTSAIEGPFLHDPQPADDSTPPEIRIAGGTDFTVPAGEKLVIDASRSFDEQDFSAVWWDFNPNFDADGDGDPTNDRDFPKNPRDYLPPSKLLKIRLPERFKPGKINTILNVEDASGNRASKKISVAVEMPEIEIFEASARSARVAGRVRDARAGLPIQIFRKRDGVLRPVETDEITTDENGYFSAENLENTGGVEFLATEAGIGSGNAGDDSKNAGIDPALLEILPTGRPIVFKPDRIGYTIEAASAVRPFRLKIHDRRGRPLAFVRFEQTPARPVRVENLPEFTAENLKPLQNIHLLDRNLDDRFEFVPFTDTTAKFAGSVAVVDSNSRRTLGLVDGHGNFYLSPDSSIFFRIKRAFDATDPVIFEIWWGAGVKNPKIIGELFIFTEGEVITEWQK